jgi:hypothetical protein
MSEHLKHVGDTLAVVSAMLGLLVESLPHITAFFTLIWVLVRLWQEPTVQDYLARRKT